MFNFKGYLYTHVQINRSRMNNKVIQGYMTYFITQGFVIQRFYSALYNFGEKYMCNVFSMFILLAAKHCLHNMVHLTGNSFSDDEQSNWRWSQLLQLLTNNTG